MSWWIWSLAAIGALLAVYAALVAWLALVGRREDARALATFIPDCIVLVTRLARDPRVPRARKFGLLVLLGYLALPFDLVPDFIPVAGQLDDAIIVALVIRSFVRSGGEDLVRELWPGPNESLALILRLAAKPLWDREPHRAASPSAQIPRNPAAPHSRHDGEKRDRRA
jgi:uncharacterized membrane protein YkvA (DUF1232 family)